jgi:hypothetical protein
VFVRVPGRRRWRRDGRGDGDGDGRFGIGKSQF